MSSPIIADEKSVYEDESRLVFNDSEGMSGRTFDDGIESCVIDFFCGALSRVLSADKSGSRLWGFILFMLWGIVSSATVQSLKTISPAGSKQVSALSVSVNTVAGEMKTGVTTHSSLETIA